MPKIETIDLAKARTAPQAKVYSGRDRGTFWREKFEVDSADEQSEPVKVLIPTDIISVNISFFLGLFGKSVRQLGREEFSRHYVFECEPILRQLIEQGITQALKRSNALGET